ncbi:hypothetical protein RQP46_005924 [Phenoliferia psychrophenolica]
MLRTKQTESYWTTPTRQSLFREAFGLPDDETPLAEVHAVLSLQGKPEAYSGKLYLSSTFLAFASLDRRSCRLSLPLATVRRVEKIAPGQEGTATGAFALCLTLFHGLRIVVQLNSLRTTNDAFCAVLRTQLKAALPMMKKLKPFSKTFFSEWFLAPDRDADLVVPADLNKPGQASSTTEGELISFGDEKPLEEKPKELLEGENVEWTTRSETSNGYHGGLGTIFKYPGDPRKLREKSKMKLWKEYLRQHGRNLTLIRYPAFNRLVQVGLPNRLRGEVWELTCGSMYLRLQNPGVYEQILRDNAGRTSPSTDDIEKDLHRSLPEYAAYQDERGIDAMRRVLTAYSWRNPELGYCQAMNLVVASFLIFMSEEQCFWCLSVLCDRLLPGYYSPSMYGTVLDQRVFEHLVERCLPSIHDHFIATDIQLSVASLPWFLSCFISSLPMVFAFRVVDCLLLMGPKVLFQISLAILKINGEELLATTDDGAFINCMKSYFASLGDPAHPRAPDSRTRQITKFQELLVVAFREFSIITDETIASERKRFRREVVVSIETFAKRTQLRNLKRVGRLDKDRLGLAWLKVVKNGFHEHTEREPVDHELIDRIFFTWDKSHAGELSFQDVVDGLDSVLFNDLMSNLAWLFSIHDKDLDGYLTKDEVLQLSESLLFIFRNEPGDRYLGSVSNLMQNLFEYAESTKPDAPSSTDRSPSPPPAASSNGGARRQSLVSENPNRPYLGLSTFRMCVLADPLLEDFFASDLTQSWRLDVLIAEEKPKAPGAVGGAVGWLGGLVSSVMTESNKERLNRLADEVGRRLEIQTIEHRPSIGKLDAASAALEPTARDSLFSTSVSSRPSTATSRTSPHPSPSLSSSEVPHPLSAAAMRMPAYPSPSPSLESIPPVQNPWADVPSSRRDVDIQRAAAMMERPQFVIDDMGDGDEDEDEGVGRDELLDEVDEFLKSAPESDGALVDKTAAQGQELLSREDGKSLI